MHPSKMNIIIVGPTGAGKTATACALAHMIGGEIISADSRQVYRHLDVGTNKTGTWDNAHHARVAGGIPQYLTDLIEPSGVFSAGEFVRCGLEKTAEIISGGKRPIIVGGTGMYVKALVDGLAPLPPRDTAFRAKLAADLTATGKEALYERLSAVDPAAAEAHRYNPQRLIRALEVYYLTGTPVSELQKNTHPALENCIQFGITAERRDLYRRLDERCGEMLRSGMIEETEKVLSLGFPADSPGLQGIGYRGIIQYLQGQLTLAEVEEQMKRDTRHYAKRQLTWFAKDRRIHWLRTGAHTADPSEIARQIMKLL